MAKHTLNPHGGDIYRASQEYGIKKEELLDYSANINPLGVPAEFRELIISNIDHLVNYPEPRCESLRWHIARYLDTAQERIIVGNGASEIIFLIFDILRPRKVMIPAPSFCEYAQAAERHGTQVEYVRLEEEKGFMPDVDALLQNMSEDVDAIILCNPNNPTSTLVPKDQLLRLIRQAQSRNVFVILDEAFIELTEGGNDNSMVGYLDELSKLFIVRAFTKVFAVPGIRLGYGIGSPGLIESMWERKMPWSVNTFACAFGEFISKAQAYIEETALWLCEERRWFYEELRKIEALKVFEPNTNFVLLKLQRENLTAGKLRDIMAAKGILIRDASNFEFLDGSFFRLAIKSRKDNERLIRALRESL